MNPSGKYDEFSNNCSTASVCMCLTVCFCCALQVRGRVIESGQALDVPMRRLKYEARKESESAASNALTAGIGQGTAAHTIK